MHIPERHALGNIHYVFVNEVAGLDLPNDKVYVSYGFIHKVGFIRFYTCVC